MTLHDVIFIKLVEAFPNNLLAETGNKFLDVYMDVSEISTPGSADIGYVTTNRFDEDGKDHVIGIYLTSGPNNDMEPDEFEYDIRDPNFNIQQIIDKLHEILTRS